MDWWSSCSHSTTPTRFDSFWSSERRVCYCCFPDSYSRIKGTKRSRDTRQPQKWKNDTWTHVFLWQRWNYWDWARLKGLTNQKQHAIFFYCRFERVSRDLINCDIWLFFFSLRLCALISRLEGLCCRDHVPACLARTHLAEFSQPAILAIDRDIQTFFLRRSYTLFVIYDTSWRN